MKQSVVRSNHEHPRVSVIIPIYGVERYIERCVRSLFEQTLNDLEFIFIDDCTPDNSIEILNNLIEEYSSRIEEKRWIVKTDKMPTNSGLTAVRRHGLQFATGAYVIHCDSDDFVEPDMYESMYSEAERGMYDLVFSDFYIEYNGKVSVRKRMITGLDRKHVVHDVIFGSTWNVWSVMVKRLLVNSITLPNRTNGEDLATIIQLICSAKNYSYVRRPLYRYVVYSNSASHNKLAEKIPMRVEEKIDNTNIAINALEQQEIDFKNEIIFLKVVCRLWNGSSSKKVMGELWNKIYPELTIKDVLMSSIPIVFKFKFLVLSIYYRY